MIDCFDGKYRFLSNFYPALVWVDSTQYPTVEHAFQAAKTISFHHRMDIALADTPGKAKRLGRKVPLREDWEEVKSDVMEDLVRQKFQDPTLKKELLATGDEELVEGNTWNDCVWGMTKDAQGTWVGENRLGKILMKIRQELKGGGKDV